MFIKYLHRNHLITLNISLRRMSHFINEETKAQVNWLSQSYMILSSDKGNLNPGLTMAGLIFILIYSFSF